MKILFNRRPIAGPWGGGSKVLSAIKDECLNRNYNVFFEEEIQLDINFDIIFCMDPRPTQTTDFNKLLLKKNKNSRSKIVQRIGDLGTHGKPELFELVKITSQLSDILIFPSLWAKNYLNSQHKKCFVIQNAPLKDFIIQKHNRTISNPLKIVSHHWSNNQLKGFDIYKKLDDYCKVRNTKFTFIGRKPDNLQLSNYINPLSVEDLILEIPKHDVYITASKNESGANHVLEAMALGLPILYHKDGGSINEYCQNYGIAYDNFEDLIFIIENRKEDLQNLSNNMLYQRSSRDMACEYVNLFESLI